MTTQGVYFVNNGQLTTVETWDEAVLLEPNSAYEVLRVIDGVPLFWADHLARLFATLNTLGIGSDLTTSDIRNSVRRLLVGNRVANGNVQILYTGATLGLYVFQIRASYPQAQMYDGGVAVGLLHAERERPEAKVLSPELRQRANALMQSNDLYEALLVNRQSYITEGSRSNVFFLRGGIVYTCPARWVLSGITRQYVLEACRTVGVSVVESMISVDSLPSYEAAFLTGTSPKVLPIARLEALSFDPQNAQLQAIRTAYDALLAQYIHSHRATWQD